MSAADGTLLVGLGSPYGDDQLGWRLVEEIGKLCRQPLSVQRAHSALQLFDWLGGVQRLVVCDACQGIGAVGTWRRWRWPSDDLKPLRAQGSHDLGLAAVLALAETLGQLPGNVSIWAIEGLPAAGAGLPPDGALSLEVEQAISRVAALVIEELSRPR